MPPPKTLITGMGCCCAPGFGIAELQHHLGNLPVRCGPVPPDLFATDLPFPAFMVGRPLHSPMAARLLSASPAARFLPSPCNRTLLLTLEAVAEAVTAAAITPETLLTARIGVILGTTVGCTFNNEEYYAAWRGGLEPELTPVRNYLGSNLAAMVRTVLGAQGPAAVLTNACSSGTDALGLAKIWLEQDCCDLVIAGGADELSRIAYHGFSALMLMARTPCQPFDQARTGLNLGEGAGILILEREDRLRREATPKGILLGYGAATDGYHPTAPHPEGRGLKNALLGALADADAGPSEIAYINAHGTGTLANDEAEAAALAQFPFPAECRVVSTKGSTGHTLGAAGAIEAIITLLTLAGGVTAGTPGCREIDPALPVPVLPEGKSARLFGRKGISQSLAFGGFNGAVVLEAIG
jgi:3-oxoacyl-[acyl-carrier-protein] synthase-1/3-oxoacyl-[acyl-carrier-protein] synthase II